MFLISFFFYQKDIRKMENQIEKCSFIYKKIIAKQNVFAIFNFLIDKIF